MSKTGVAILSTCFLIMFLCLDARYQRAVDQQYSFLIYVLDTYCGRVNHK